MNPLRPARAPISRGLGARERILRAALEILAEHGFRGFTMEAIAQRAQASKATLYRRWTSRARLLVDAMELSAQPLSIPTTGSVRADLIELVNAQHKVLNTQPFPRLLAAFIDAAERDPTVALAHTQLTEARREPLRHVLAEARRCGEIFATADLELAVDLLGAPAFYRRFVAHRGLGPTYAAAVVDHVLAAMGYAVPEETGATATPGDR